MGSKIVLLGLCLALVAGINSQNLSSCVGRCNSGLNPGAPCQCNDSCDRFGDCCTDYESICLGEPGEESCSGKCGLPLDPSSPCQCNDDCSRFGDCCPDYSQQCGGSSDGVTDAELIAIAEELFALDENNAASFVTVSPDSNPVLTISEGAYSIPTISKLVAMYDNYIANVRSSEQVTAEELAEETEFLDLVFATPVMIRAQEFMASKNMPTGRDYLYEKWFGLYNRGGGTLGSSGFEHVFLGEIMSGISGFHNWIFFAHEEQNGNLENLSTAKLLDLGGKGWVIENSIRWLGETKPIGGGFIGTSPEFELAIHTICWIARQDKLCPIKLNGKSLSLQTYKTSASHSSTNTYISTAYTVLP